MLTVHTILGLAALGTGAAIVVLPKGTRMHRWLGRSYAVAMVGLCLSAFALPAQILPLVGDYGVFHAFALFGLGHLAVGLAPILWHGNVRNWMQHHLYFMLWSFVGLLMATNSHVYPHVGAFLVETLGMDPIWAMIGTGVVLWGVPVVVGTVLIERKKAAVARPGAEVEA